MLALEPRETFGKVGVITFDSSLTLGPPQEGEKLFCQLNTRFSADDEEGDSITGDAVMRHAQLFFDTYSPQDQAPPELSEKSLSLLPEVYFSVTCMKVRSATLFCFGHILQFLDTFIESTRELTNFSSFPFEAQSTRFKSVSSLRRYFRAWSRHKQDNSDSEEEEEDDFFEDPT